MKTTISDLSQLLAFRHDLRDELRFAGCSEEALQSALLALTELGTNLVRHAAGGELEASLVGTGGTTLRLIAVNRVIPGRLPAGGLGLGLATVERLMTRVSVAAADDVFRVVAELELDAPRAAAPLAMEA